jgi:acid phosphatase
LLIVLTTLVLVLSGCTRSAQTGRPAARTSAPTSAGSSPTSAGPSSPTSAAPSSAAPTSAGSSSPTAAGVPRFAHIVIAVLENHSFDQVVGQPDAPFISSLVATGAVMTQSYALTHPSEPNYLAMFSGSTQGISDDACPLSFSGPNLARSLLDAGQTFAGYAEDLPAVGYTGCSAGLYARKHSPWVNFTNVPASLNLPMTRFPSRYAQLPTVSFVIPNLEHDMHDGSLAAADSWLHGQLGGYAAWAPSHNSLLIITADEDDHSADNRIATLLVGAHVAPGRYAQRTDHYGLLRTIEDAYGLAPVGNSAQANPISGIWTR